MKSLLSVSSMLLLAAVVAQEVSVAIPVIRCLNRAGWQPETLLRANAESIWIERYGEPGGSGECLFTVRNASEKAIDAVLMPEFPVKSLTPVLHGTGIAQSEKIRFKVRLEP